MNLFIILVTTIMQSTISVSSPAFQDGKMIPSDYTCQGKNISPPLDITNIPDKTVSLAIIAFDPDAPGGGFDHWVMFNILPGKSIKEDDAPGTQGANGKGDAQYTGPCPPSGVHHYHFTVYALDIKLDLTKGAQKELVLEKMKGHILATGELTGLYSKDNESLNKR